MSYTLKRRGLGGERENIKNKPIKTGKKSHFCAV